MLHLTTRVAGPVMTATLTSTLRHHTNSAMCFVTCCYGVIFATDPR